jgi:predicted membrane metal-binding protein
MGVLVVLVAFVAAYSARRLVALTDRSEMLETYRHIVAANVQWARRMQWAVAAIVALLLYKAFTGTAASYDPAVYYGGLALPTAAAWLYLRRVKLPRAEREARDLGLSAGVGR